MIKTIGQNGLNFIANKYKELRTALSNKVDKVSGKSLSTNDYDSTAKAKVDAIPSNPKYTDTIVSVVDNLSTSDSTKALSANQGKALQDNKADKSNISRCKTKGFDTSYTWQSTSNTRDLEDWIGDFDKRTRELKDGGSKPQLNQYTSFFSQDRSFTQVYWSFLKIGKIAIITYNGRQTTNEATRMFNLPAGYNPLMNIAFECSATDRHPSQAFSSSIGLVYGTLDYNGILYFREPMNFSYGAELMPFTIIYECAQ